MALQAQEQALKQLNLLQNGTDHPDRSILDGYTEDNLRTRIGTHSLVAWLNTAEAGAVIHVTGYLTVSLKAGVVAAGYLLMDKVANFTDADVEKLAEPLRPLVGASQGVQV